MHVGSVLRFSFPSPSGAYMTLRTDAPQLAASASNSHFRAQIKENAQATLPLFERARSVDRRAPNAIHHTLMSALPVTNANARDTPICSARTCSRD